MKHGDDAGGRLQDAHDSQDPTAILILGLQETISRVRRLLLVGVMGRRLLSFDFEHDERLLWRTEANAALEHWRV
jgi:hypothetical protein